jgi:hypothetical protein
MRRCDHLLAAEARRDAAKYIWKALEPKLAARPGVGPVGRESLGEQHFDRHEAATHMSIVHDISPRAGVNDRTIGRKGRGANPSPEGAV